MAYCIRDPRMRELVHSTAMDAVTDSFKIRLDRSKVSGGTGRVQTLSEAPLVTENIIQGPCFSYLG